MYKFERWALLILETLEQITGTLPINVYALNLLSVHGNKEQRITLANFGAIEVNMNVAK